MRERTLGMAVGLACVVATGLTACGDDDGGGSGGAGGSGGTDPDITCWWTGPTSLSCECGDTTCDGHRTDNLECGGSEANSCC